MEDLLKSALREYKEQFGEDFDTEWDPSDEHDLAERIGASKIDFEIWRSKHRKIWHSLWMCARPLTNIGRVALDAAASGFPPSSAVVGGLISLIRTCEEVSEAYDFLEQMFAKLEDALSRWKLDFKHDVDEHLKTRMQEIVFLVFSIIVRSRKVIKKGRFRAYFRALTLGKDEKLTELMENLDTALQSEDRARATISLAKLNALWEKSIRTETAQVVERLYHPAVENNAKNYAELVEEMVPNTGRWIEDENLYSDWIQGKLPLLLVCGGPGSGKSFVATSIIANLVQQYRQTNTGQSPSAIGYFYVNKDIDLITMLKGLAYQLQSTNSDYQDFVVDIFEQGNIRTAREIWRKLFLTYWAQQLESEREVFIVIDGLDQMNEDDVDLFAGEMVREMLKDGFAAGKIHLCISGRPSLVANFEFVPTDMYIRTESSKNKSDMTTFVMDGLKGLRSLKKVSSEVRQQFCNQILDSCDGNFEWAQLLLHKCRHLDKRRIEKLIQDPPKDLDEMIKSCFDQIIASEEIDPDALRTLLTWLTYSKRSLMFGELYNAVALSTEDQHPLLWFHIVKNLSSLVRWRSTRTGLKPHDGMYDESLEVLNEEDDSWSEELSTTVLMLRHTRIRDYLISRSNSSETTDDHADRYLPSKSEAELEASKVCLQLMRNKRIFEPKFRFLSIYPATFMIQHLKSIDMASLEESDRFELADSLVQLFLTEDGHRSFIISIIESKTVAYPTFWPVWVSTSENTKLVQHWFKIARGRREAYQDTVAEWIDRSIHSVKTLFKPFAKTLQRAWLCAEYGQQDFDEFDDMTDTTAFAWVFLMAYENMDEDGIFPARFRSYSITQMSSYSHDEVIRAASKSGLPQDANYNVGLSIVFTTMGQAAWALPYAKLAFEQDPTCWVAAWYIARASAAAHDIDEALHWAEVAANLNEKAASTIEATRAFLTLKKSGRRGAREALRRAEKAYEVDATNSMAIHFYFLCLALNDDDRKLIEMWRKTAKVVSQQKGKPFLNHLVASGMETLRWSITGFAYRSCRSEEEKTLIMESLDAATAHTNQTASEVDQVRWHTHLAHFYWTHVEDGGTRAETMLDKLMSRVKESKVLLDPAVKVRLLSSVIVELLAWKYCKALAQQRDGNEGLSSTVEEIGQLANEISDTDMAFTSNEESHFLAFKPALLHARMVRETLADAEEQWRTAVRRPLKYYADMLEDSETSNDIWGLIMLGRVLATAGERRSSRDIEHLLLLQMAQRSLDSNHLDLTKLSDMESQCINVESSGTTDMKAASENRQEDDILELDLNIDINITCRVCYLENLESGRFFTCTTCSKAYCERCRPSEVEDAWLGRACGSQHHFEESWRLDQAKLNPNIVKVGTYHTLSKNWLKKFKKEWSLE